jgi:hypothetical protein
VSVFGKKDDDPLAQELIDEIRRLSKEVAELRGERDAGKEAVKLSSDIASLKKELTDLRIEKDRETEKHEREKREVEHMVGLEKKRQEFEVDAAKRDVKLTVREENLKEDRQRFEQEMQFTRERFEKEVGYLQGLMKEVLERLPTVTVEKSIDLAMNGNGNGQREKAEVD